jgi:1A family penicillin-binding protein
LPNNNTFSARAVRAAKIAGARITKFFRQKSVRSLLLIAATAALVVAGGLVVWATTISLPDVRNFENRRIAESTKIYDRTGKVVLYDVHGNVRRTVVPFEEISQDIKEATIAIEDQGFYEHGGIQPSAIVRAVWINLTTGDLLGGQGGSTITQQVIKNALLTSEKKISRKVKEWVLAIRLEKVLSKDEILSVYLNEVPYGGPIYGVEEASRRFFGKSAKDVTLLEAAYLAALPQAPTYYSPYGNHREALDARKNLVLERMLDNGYITQEEYDGAMATEVAFQAQSEYGIKAPHFVMYVRELLEAEYGREAIEQGGLKVITTIDWELQDQAEQIVSKWALQNEKLYNAENAAMVGVDPKTGQIVVMVGSRDFFDEEIDGEYNIAIAERQPGSAMKPIAYAAAFAKGYRPETVLFDLPTEFSATCASGGSCYSPQNYDEVFRGPMTLRDALANSINVPAVKVAYLVGVENLIDVAKKMGLSTIEGAQNYGLSLVLGGGEVKPLEMANAYATFARNGEYLPTAPVLRIEDREGNVLYDWEEERDEPREVLEPSVAALVSDVLSDNNARIPSYGANSPLFFPGRQVAAKTGTTNDYRDTWIVGYTPSISVAAWAGNNDNSPMEKRVAGFIVAPMWNEFMQFALEKLPEEGFPTPPGLPEGSSNAIAGRWQDQPQTHEILHWVNKDNPLGPAPSNPSRDPQYWLWEAPLNEWLRDQGRPTPGDDDGSDDDGGDADEVSVSIRSPRAGERHRKGEPLVVRAQVRGDIIASEVYLGEKFAGSLDESGRLSIQTAILESLGDSASLLVTVAGPDGSTDQDRVTVTFR